MELTDSGQHRHCIREKGLRHTHLLHPEEKNLIPMLRGTDHYQQQYQRHHDATGLQDAS